MLTTEAARVLEAAPFILLRTARHPVVDQFPPSIRWESLDGVYDANEGFADLYQNIAEAVLARARQEGELVYAVPGDPTVAEDSVRELLGRAAEAEADVRIVPGVSFIEASMAAVRCTMSGGLQLLDASQVAAANPLLDLLVYQIEDEYVASDVKLELLRCYPDDHPVLLVKAASVLGEQSVQQVHLHDLDRHINVDHLTALYVPAAAPERSIGSFAGLVQIVARLRALDGCPWDREQTHSSLKPYVVEEAYEVVEAIDRGDPATLSEELGDLLLQVLLHAQIGSEAGDFDLTDVVASIAAKMVRRHPHVFGDVSVSGSRDVLANWEAIKKAEKDGNGGMFDGVPKQMPALQAAQEMQGRAARIGFDWDNVQDVLAKVAEELDELSRAEDAARREEEFGDLLFALVNSARHLGVNAEMALRSANRKFVDRFTRMEELAQEEGVELASLKLEQQDALWNRAKAEEQGQG